MDTSPPDASLANPTTDTSSETLQGSPAEKTVFTHVVMAQFKPNTTQNATAAMYYPKVKPLFHRLFDTHKDAITILSLDHKNRLSYGAHFPKHPENYFKFKIDPNGKIYLAFHIRTQLFYSNLRNSIFPWVKTQNFWFVNSKVSIHKLVQRQIGFLLHIHPHATNTSAMETVLTRAMLTAQGISVGDTIPPHDIPFFRIHRTPIRHNHSSTMQITTDGLDIWADLEDKPRLLELLSQTTFEEVKFIPVGIKNAAHTSMGFFNELAMHHEKHQSQFVLTIDNLTQDQMHTPIMTDDDGDEVTLLQYLQTQTCPHATDERLLDLITFHDRIPNRWSIVVFRDDLPAARDFLRETIDEFNVRYPVDTDDPAPQLVPIYQTAQTKQYEAYSHATPNAAALRHRVPSRSTTPKTATPPPREVIVNRKPSPSTTTHNPAGPNPTTAAQPNAWNQDNNTVTSSTGTPVTHNTTSLSTITTQLESIQQFQQDQKALQAKQQEEIIHLRQELQAARQSQQTFEQQMIEARAQDKADFQNDMTKMINELATNIHHLYTASHPGFSLRQPSPPSPPSPTPPSPTVDPNVPPPAAETPTQLPPPEAHQAMETSPSHDPSVQQKRSISELSVSFDTSVSPVSSPPKDYTLDFAEEASIDLDPKEFSASQLSGIPDAPIPPPPTQTPPRRNTASPVLLPLSSINRNFSRIPPIRGGRTGTAGRGRGSAR